MKKANNIILKFIICTIVCVNLFFSSKIFAQKKYEFKVENPIKYKFDPLIYDGITFEFQGTRIYINKSMFYETSVLREIDTFRVSNENWHIKKNGVWKLFFSKKDFQNKSIVEWKGLYLRPYKKINEHGQLFYLYYLGAEKKFVIDEEHFYSLVYFSPTDGVMKIKYENFSLYREWLQKPDGADMSSQR